MAGDINIKHGTKQTLTTTGLSTLASAGTATSNTVDVTTDNPIDVLIELYCNPGTVSGNKQALLYVVTSLDNTNFADTDADSYTKNLPLLAAVFFYDTTAIYSHAFSVAAACGGTLPRQFRIFVVNDSGATFDDASLSYVIVEAQYT